MSEENTDYALYPDQDMDRRPRYYDGQFLRAPDFVDAQRYDVARRRRFVRYTVSRGVVSGLGVTGRKANNRCEVTIAAGAAIDDVGRQIVMVAAQSFIVSDGDRKVDLVAYITFAESTGDAIDDTWGEAGPTRFVELPTVGYVRSGATLPDHAVELGRFRFNNSRAFSLKSGYRRWAARRVRQHAEPHALTLGATNDDPGRARLGAALTIDVPPGTRHSPTQPAVKVNGHAMVTGTMVVGQEATTGYAGQISDADDVIARGSLAVAGGAALFKLGIGQAPPPNEGELLVSQRVGVNREAVDPGLQLQVEGAGAVTQDVRVAVDARVGGGASVGRNARVTLATTVGGGLIANAGAQLGGATVGHAITVNGDVSVGADLSVSGQLTVDGSLIGPQELRSAKIWIGHGVAGRYRHNGRLQYGVENGTALGIIGGGTTAGSRKIKMWAEGGATVDGPVTVGDVAGDSISGSSLRTTGTLTVGGALQASGAATASSTLDLTGKATFRGALIVGQTGTTGYKGVPAGSNSLIVNGQLAAGGSAGSAIFSLGVGQVPPANAEGTLTTRSLAVNAEAVDNGRVFQAAGAARFQDHLSVGGGVAVGGRLSVAQWSAAGIAFPNDPFGGSGDRASLYLSRYGNSGENQGLFLAIADGANDVIALRQSNADVGLLRSGRLGVRKDSPAANLHVGAGARIDTNLRIDGVLEAAGVIDLGAGVSGREGNAGKIGYRVFRDDVLAIVGAGTTNSNRKVRVWSEGGMHIAGQLTVSDLAYNSYGVLRSTSGKTRVLFARCKSGDGTDMSVGITNRWHERGRFQVTFSPAFSGRPAVVVTQIGDGNTKDNANVYSISASGCWVKTGDGGGDRSTRPYAIIAIGPA